MTQDQMVLALMASIASSPLLAKLADFSAGRHRARAEESTAALTRFYADVQARVKTLEDKLEDERQECTARIDDLQNKVRALERHETNRERGFSVFMAKVLAMIGLARSGDARWHEVADYIEKECETALHAMEGDWVN